MEIITLKKYNGSYRATVKRDIGKQIINILSEKEINILKWSYKPNKDNYTFILFPEAIKALVEDFMFTFLVEDFMFTFIK
jgi:hypothetical protein